MKLEELSMLQKDTAEMIDSFVKTADTKSGEECCKAYIEKNNNGLFLSFLPKLISMTCLRAAVR